MAPASLQAVLDTFALFSDPTDRTNLLLDYADRFKEVPAAVATRPFGKEHRIPHCESDAYVWAIKQPGGMEATQLRVAEQYVDRFGQLAQEGTTLILPANVADVASMVSTAMRVFKQEQQK